MIKSSDQLTTYEADILAWRKEKEDSLRREDGWLTLVGLYWLEDGENTVGSDPACRVVLPASSAPNKVGVITFHDGVAMLTTNEPVLVDDAKATTAILRYDTAEDGPSIVAIGTVSFFVIKRGDEYAIRVRDANSPERQSFTGRKWFDIDPAYRIKATFTPHTPPRTVTVINTVGQSALTENPGYVEFKLHGQSLRLEAFTNDAGDLWFIFKDATSGPLTYGAGRYLIAPLAPDGTVDLDFNRAYSPPCAFTRFATCPLPVKENILSVQIEAGEKV